MKNAGTSINYGLQPMRPASYKSIKISPTCCTLLSGKIFFYTASMDGLTTGLILALCTVGIYTIVQKWWRHRQAAKLADKLLDDVIKGKDAFRR